MQWLQLFSIGLLTTVTYGVINNQVTARICIEFFDLFPLRIANDSPTAIATAYGIWSTWWLGVFFGGLMATVGRVGRLPKIAPATIARPVGLVLSGVATTAAVFGVAGYFLYSSTPWNTLPQDIRAAIPPDKVWAFFVVNSAHSGAYVSGVAGALILCYWMHSERVAAATAGTAEIAPAVPVAANPVAWRPLGAVGIAVHAASSQISSSPPTVRALFGAVAAYVVCFVYLNVPPGITTICLTVAIAVFFGTLILRPDKRYFRGFSTVLGAWLFQTTGPSISAWLNLGEIAAFWSSTSPPVAFHVICAVLMMMLLVLDFLHRKS